MYIYWRRTRRHGRLLAGAMQQRLRADGILVFDGRHRFAPAVGAILLDVAMVIVADRDACRRRRRSR